MNPQSSNLNKFGVWPRMTNEQARLYDIARMQAEHSRSNTLADILTLTLALVFTLALFLSL